MCMQWVGLFIIGFLLSTAECDSHCLEFLSIGLVQPGDRPLFERLTALDRITISYCDSFTRKEELKQRLVSKNILPGDCESAHSDILEALYVIPAFTNSTLYTVQRRRGCILSADETVSAFEAWAVNGKDFLTFDPHSLEWRSQSPAAITVRQNWNERRIRNQAFSHFIRTECPRLIKKIKLKPVTPKTDLHIFAKTIPDSAKVSLRCHVTSTDKSVSTVHLIGDGVSRTTVTGPLPSGDGSVILRLTAEISPGQDVDKYVCKIQTGIHNLSVMWDGCTLDGRCFTKQPVQWEPLMIFLGVFGVLGIISFMSCSIILLLRCVKPKSRPPSIDPQLRQHFINLLDSENSPAMRMFLISFIFGAHIPEEYQECQTQWDQIVTSNDETYYDPDFYGPQIHGMAESTV